MDKRVLGRTGLEVGVLGIGTEFLNGQDAGTYDAVLHTAAECGVNYIDVLFAFSDYRDKLAAAMRGIRDKFVITGHIGCAETDGQYRKSRDAAECETIFDDLLRRLGTDYIDVVMIQFVDGEKNYEQIMQPGGLYELAARLQRSGKARFIGVSTHDYAIAERAAASGNYDVIMYPIGIILFPIPNEGMLAACDENGVGVVAMKPYGGGRLFGYAEALTIDPTRLVGFPLIDRRISTVAAGVKSLKEFQLAVAGIENSPSTEELTTYAAGLFAAGKGDCVYCNHCLPCPAKINIGETLMLLDWAEREGSRDASKDGGADKVRESYGKLEVKASACTACGACETRCPFEVPVVERMTRAVEVFGE